MHAPIHHSNIKVVTPLNMIQMKPVVFQDSDDIVERPIEDALGHTLDPSKSEIFYLNW